MSATLETLRERHDSAPPNQKAIVRMRARRLASDLGVPVPPWAAPRPRGPAEPRPEKETHPRPGPSLDEIRERHDRATDNQTRANIRGAARRLAERLGTDIPAWAASTRPPARSLGSLQARHDASADDRVRAAVRTEARRLAEDLSEPVPEWASLRIRPRGEPASLEALSAKHADPEASESTRRAARSAARKLAKAQGAECPEFARVRPRHRGQNPIRSTRDADNARTSGSIVTIPTEIPEPLRAWAKIARGAVVELNRAGVVLHELGQAPLRFPSVEAAIAAVG